MPSYTVTGHPLNYAELDLPEFAANAIKTTGVGNTISLTVSNDTKAKGHGALK